MFNVEIKNLKVFDNIGITSQERKNKQLLKVTLNFSYAVPKGKDLESMSNLKDYSGITKSLRQYISQSKHHTLEKLIISSSHMLEKRFKLKKVTIKVNKTEVAKRYGAESEEFMMHEEAMQYVDRINLYYQTLSILERGDELFLLAKK